MRALVFLAITSTCGCIFDPSGTLDEASSEAGPSTTVTTGSASGGDGASSQSSSSSMSGGGTAGGMGGIGGMSSSSTAGGTGGMGTGGGSPCGDGDIDAGEECDQGPGVSAFCVDCMLVCPAPISGISFSKSTVNTPTVCYAAKLGGGGDSKGLDFGSGTNLNERCSEYATTLGVDVVPSTPNVAADVTVVGMLLGANSGWIGAKRSAASWAWSSSDTWTYVDQMSPWGASEPNDFMGNQDCVSIIGANTLNDADCNNDLIAVCEVRPPGE